MNSNMTAFNQRVAQRFGSAASHYDAQALAQRQSAQQLIAEQTLQGRVLDIGCGTGWLTRHIAEHNLIDSIVALDIALPMLKAEQLQHPLIVPIQADAAFLPFKENSFDAVVSNFALQWLTSPQNFAQELARVLAQDGQFCLAIPVDGTLQELNQAWAKVDSSRHTNQFFASLTWLKVLQSVGLTIKSYHQSAFYQYYDSTKALLKSLKAIGANELQQPRQHGLWGRGQLLVLEQAMECYRQPQGIPLHYEVLMVYGQKIH
ncbi:MAG: malonyl-ACP O-methyltransferase BioC [Moraxellaceae bacterium]|nr:malonyl-ACP O-methyltransferase BioC [Moraxellaceae bacterium]